MYLRIGRRARHARATPFLFGCPRAKPPRNTAFFLILLVELCTLPPVAACGDERERARPEAGPSDDVLVIPWVEVNTLNPTAIDRVVEGLLEWQAVTDTAIVSTMPGQESVFRTLRRRVPGMHIIPGIKTYPSLPRFDSVEGWRQIADHATAVLAAADTNELLLENETAIRQYRRGEEPVDLSRLRQGLETLPS